MKPHTNQQSAMPELDNQIDEPDWYPPPPTAGPWGQWRRRVRQVLVLSAVMIGFPLLLGLLGVNTRRTTIWLLACSVPALLATWAGLVAYLATRSAEKSGEEAERGRTLVIGLDLFGAIFTVMGVAFWFAILVL